MTESKTPRTEEAKADCDHWGHVKSGAMAALELKLITSHARELALREALGKVEGHNLNCTCGNANPDHLYHATYCICFVAHKALSSPPPPVVSKAEFDAMVKTCADWQQQAQQANDYIEKIGKEFGCLAGDDSPIDRIAEMKAEFDDLKGCAEDMAKALVQMDWAIHYLVNPSERARSFGYQKPEPARQQATNSIDAYRAKFPATEETPFSLHAGTSDFDNSAA